MSILLFQKNQNNSAYGDFPNALNKLMYPVICLFHASSFQTSFARRNAAQPFGQPTYIVAWVMMAEISSLVTPFAFAFCRL